MTTDGTDLDYMKNFLIKIDQRLNFLETKIDEIDLKLKNFYKIAQVNDAFCDKNICVEVLEKNDNFFIDSITIHETLMYKDINFIFSESLKIAKELKQQSKHLTSFKYEDMLIDVILS